MNLQQQRELLNHLEGLLRANEYKVNEEIFKGLCQIRAMVKKGHNQEIREGLRQLLHDIILCIFSPGVFSEGSGYYGAYDTNEKLSDQIYDSDSSSNKFYQILSGFYRVRSDSYRECNYHAKDRGRRKGHRALKQPAKNLLRVELRTLLRENIDENKPQPPATDNPFDKYKYDFLSALWEESKGRSEFFKKLRHKTFSYLSRNRYATHGLTALNYKFVDKNNIQTTEKQPEYIYATNVHLKFDQRNKIEYYGQLLYNKHVYVRIYGSSKENDFRNSEFILDGQYYEGTIIHHDDESNTIIVRVPGRDFATKVHKRYHHYAIVMRRDFIVEQRHKEAVEKLCDHREKYPLKNLIVKQEYSMQKNEKSASEFFNTQLNDLQKLAVSNAGACTDFFCIHGPPGTGKTKVCTEIILQQLLKKPDSRILVTAASNYAVDNILRMVSSSLPPELHSILLRIGTQEQTKDNVFSESYKIQNIEAVHDQVSSLRAREEELRTKIKSRVSTIKTLQSKNKKLNLEIEDLEKQLFDVKDKGSINERKVGIEPKINDLKHTIHVEKSQNQQLKIQLKELSTKRDEIKATLKNRRKETDANNKTIETHASTNHELNESLREIVKDIQRIRNNISTNVLRTKPVCVFSTNDYATHISEDSDFFDLLVVDEITQSTEPSVLIPVLKANKLVIAGDNHQLPPTVFLKHRSYEEDVQLNRDGERIKAYKTLATSLFERMYSTIENDIEHCVFLQQQYRMNPKIIPFLNSCIYTRKPLTCSDDLHDRLYRGGIFDSPLVFVSHEGKEDNRYDSRELGQSKNEITNPLEIKLVASLVKKYLDLGVPKERVGVITPYKEQANAIQRELATLDVSVNTVDSYQGQERDLVILSLVRGNNNSNTNPKWHAISRLGFLVDERRFNVAITRFRKQLVVIGNEDTLSLSGTKAQEYYDQYEECMKKVFYKKFIDFIKENGKYTVSKNIQKLMDRAKPLEDKEKRICYSEIQNERLIATLVSKVQNQIISSITTSIQEIRHSEQDDSEEKLSKMSEQISLLSTPILDFKRIQKLETEAPEVVLPDHVKFILDSGQVVQQGMVMQEEQGKTIPDWSAPIVQFSKAYETQLTCFFSGYIEFIAGSEEEYKEHFRNAKQDKDFASLAKHVLNGTKMTLGAMQHILETAINSVSRSETFIVKSMRKYISTRQKPEYILEKEGVIQDISAILEFRNPAAHDTIMGKEKCLEATSRIKGMVWNLCTSIS